MKQTPKSITFMPSNTHCEFMGHPSILELALENNIELDHSCGGMGSCTTCRVIVSEGVERLEARNELENEHASMRGFGERERLACQTTAIDKLVVMVPLNELA